MFIFQKTIFILLKKLVLFYILYLSGVGSPVVKELEHEKHNFGLLVPDVHIKKGFHKRNR